MRIDSESVTFYKLETDRERPFVEGSETNEWQSIICSKHEGHRRAGRRITDLSVDVLSRNAVDFSRTMLGDIVITSHAVEALRSAALTGFLVKRVTLASLPPGVDRSKFPKLWELIVSGKGGPAGKDSGIEKLRECDECGLIRYSAFKNGIVVNPATYDESDFITVTEYPKYILVSERAKSVIQNSRLTNVRFVDSAQLKWPKGVVQPT